MGVDVSEYLKEYLGDFFGVYFFSTLRVFGAQFLSICLLGSVYYFAFFWKKERIYLKNIAPILFVSLFLSLCHSMVSFPQIYGEFFYFRHIWAKPFLYFLTNHFHPNLFLVGLSLLYLLPLLKILVTFYQKKTKESAFFLMHCLVSLLIFKHGQMVFGILYVLSLPLFLQRIEAIHRKTYVFFLSVVIALFFLPWFSRKLDRFTNSGSEKNVPIILISADSLRYDKLGFVNGNPKISPSLDAFAKEAVVFHDHHTTIPRTFPSWTDLLTGHFSMSHWIRDMFPAKEEQIRIGRSPFETIPQILNREGYRSYVLGGFAADIFPRANFGYSETLTPNFNARIMTVQRTLESQLLLLPILTGSYFGMGKFIEEVDGLSTWGDGTRYCHSFEEILDRNPDHSVFITYFSSVVHFPYSPPYPHYQKFTDPDYYGNYKYLKFVDPSVAEHPNPEDVNQIRNLFDSSVYAFDEEFRRMMESLKERGLYDRSLVIVTADHGEALFEDIHGQGHGEHLRGEAVTHIPLLVKFPKGHRLGAPRDIHVPTSSIDLFPTLLAFQGLPLPSERPGSNLLGFLEGNELPADRAVYSETGIWFSDKGDHFFQKQRIPYPNILQLHRVVAEEDYQIMITDLGFRETIAFSKHRSLQTSQYKLIYIPTRQGVIWELYDRKKDPLNQKNLYPLGEVGPKLKRQLFGLVQKWEGGVQAGDYLLPGSLRNTDQ